MLKDVKSTSKHSTIYAIGNIATKLVGLILIPVYTNPEYLTQADFGALAVLEATAQFLNGVLSVAMASSIQRWYWDKNYQTFQKRILFTALAFLIGLNIPVISLLVYSSNSISSLIFGSPDFSYLLKLTLITVGIKIVNNQILHIVKLRSLSKFYATVQILNFTIVLVLTVFFVVYRGKGLNGIWEASLLGEMIVFPMLLPFTLKNIDWTFHRGILLELLGYGYPLMLSSVATVVLTVTDRYMLHLITGLEATGIYALSLRFANLLKIVVSNSINSALAPLRMKKMNEPGNQRFYSKMLTYSSFLFIFCLLGLSLFSLEVLKLVSQSSEYWSANEIIPVISFGLLFFHIRTNVKIGLVIKKRTRIMGAFIFLSAVINLALNFVLIPVFDVFGAAISTLISNLIWFLGIYYFAQKVYPVNYEGRKIILMIFITIFIIIAGYLINDIDIWVRLALKIILFASFPFILYVMNFYEGKELQSIQEIAKKWKNPKSLFQSVKFLFK